MFFLGLGIIFLLMWWLEIAPVATWAWYIVFAPFALAVAWWAWADSSGYTKRKAMDKENAKKQARIDKNKEAIGTLTTKRKR